MGIILLLVWLQACSTQETNQPSVPSLSASEATSSTNNFLDAIRLNPLDLSYGGDSGTTHVNERFAEYWLTLHILLQQ